MAINEERLFKLLEEILDRLETIIDIELDLDDEDFDIEEEEDGII